MKVGDKVVVSSHPQLVDVLFNNEVEIREITITDVRYGVPGCFGGEKKWPGYKGTDVYGLVYSCCWDSFPEDGGWTDWEGGGENEQAWYGIRGLEMCITPFSNGEPCMCIGRLHERDVKDNLNKHALKRCSDNQLLGELKSRVGLVRGKR